MGWRLQGTFWSVFVFPLCFCYKTKSRPEPSRICFHACCLHTCSHLVSLHKDLKNLQTRESTKRSHGFKKEIISFQSSFGSKSRNLRFVVLDSISWWCLICSCNGWASGSFFCFCQIFCECQYSLTFGENIRSVFCWNLSSSRSNIFTKVSKSVRFSNVILQILLVRATFPVMSLQ